MSAKPKEDAKKANLGKKSTAVGAPLVNPVLVTVGKPALPHQTPVYAW